jgi:hypothetical protein
VGAAVNQLDAFQNKVRAQIAPANPNLADALILASEQIANAAHLAK